MSGCSLLSLSRSAAAAGLPLPLPPPSFALLSSRQLYQWPRMKTAVAIRGHPKPHLAAIPIVFHQPINKYTTDQPFNNQPKSLSSLKQSPIHYCHPLPYKLHPVNTYHIPTSFTLHSFTVHYHLSPYHYHICSHLKIVN